MTHQQYHRAKPLIEDLEHYEEVLEKKEYSITIKGKNVFPFEMGDENYAKARQAVVEMIKTKIEFLKKQIESI